MRIEVKGRIDGADTFTITKNEVVTAKNLGDDYRLALVSVSPLGAAQDRVRYVERPFDGTPVIDQKPGPRPIGYHGDEDAPQPAE